MLFRRLISSLLHEAPPEGRQQVIRVSKQLFKRINSQTHSFSNYSSSHFSHEFHLAQRFPIQDYLSNSTNSLSHSIPVDAASYHEVYLPLHEHIANHRNSILQSIDEYNSAEFEFDDGTNLNSNFLHSASDATHGSHEFCEFEEFPTSSELSATLESQHRQQINDLLLQLKFDELEREFELRQQNEERQRIAAAAESEKRERRNKESSSDRRKYIALASAFGLVSSDDDDENQPNSYSHSYSSDSDYSTVSKSNAKSGPNFFSAFSHGFSPMRSSGDATKHRTVNNKIRSFPSHPDNPSANTNTNISSRSRTANRRDSYIDLSSPSGGSSDENSFETHSNRSLSPASTTSSGSSGSNSPVSSSRFISRAQFDRIRLADPFLTSKSFSQPPKPVIQIHNANSKLTTLFGISVAQNQFDQMKSESIENNEIHQVKSKSRQNRHQRQNENSPKSKLANSPSLSISEFADFTALDDKVDSRAKLILRPADLESEFEWRRLEAFLLAQPSKVNSIRFHSVDIRQDFADSLFRSGSLTRMQTIIFCDNNIGTRDGTLNSLISAVLNCKELKNFSIIRNSLNDVHAEKLSELIQFHPSLLSISLCFNGIQSAGAQKLSIGIQNLSSRHNEQAQSSPLERIDFSYNQFGFRGIAYINHALLELSKCNKSLNINLNHNENTI